MSTLVETLKKGLNYILPRTVLKAIADKNQQYLSNDLLASDLNALKNGEVGKLESNFAPIEESPSQNPYVVGARLVYNGILYTVKSAIAVDDLLVVGTNIERKNVADSLSDIIEYTQGTLTVESGFYSSDSRFICFKIGKTVYIALNATVVSSLSDNYLQVVVPQGFRPTSNKNSIMGWFAEADNTIEAYGHYFVVKTDGQILQQVTSFLTAGRKFSILFIYTV